MKTKTKILIPTIICFAVAVLSVVLHEELGSEANPLNWLWITGGVGLAGGATLLGILTKYINKD